MSENTVIGPVQMLAVQFDDPSKFEGKIIHELRALRKKGLIRLVDFLFVAKKDDGQLTTFTHSDLDDAELAEFGTAIGKMIGLEEGEDNREEVAGAIMLAETNFGMDLSDVKSIAEQVEPGTAMGILLLEHLWATGLKSAIRNTGGVPVAQGFLTPEVLFMAGQELEAIVTSLETIEAAQTAEAVAVLDALITVSVAEEVKEEAIADAEATVIAGEMIKTAVAADVMRTLIAAEIIEEAAVEHALETLIAAELIEEAALEEAAVLIAATEEAVESAEMEAGDA